MKKGIHICPDLDLMSVMGSWLIPLNECKQEAERLKTHKEMIGNLSCHVYKGTQYCFCSLKTKVKS